MKKTLMTVLVLLSGLGWAADNTYSFTYQAALRDEHGLVISNGTAVARNQTITLRLWDSATGGNLLWGRTYNVYTDETGLFNLEVTDGAGSKVDDAPDNVSLEGVFSGNLAGAVYIGIQVKNSSGEIVPRQRLFAVPFAAVANDVRKISGNVSVGGNINLGNNVIVTKDGIQQTSGDSTFQNLKANGTLQSSGQITSGGGLVVNGGVVNFSPDVSLKRRLTVTGATALNGGLTVSGGNVALASGSKVTVGGEDILPVPVGGIIMWTKSALPDNVHWAICDGQEKDGIRTPDLRNRFIVGAGSDYAAGDTGGENKHMLTVQEMPKHSHTYSFSTGDIAASWKNSRYFFDYSNHYNTHQSKTTDETGGSLPHENRPPYYALYYIMRIK